jgi:hypothetical protein
MTGSYIREAHCNYVNAKSNVDYLLDVLPWRRLSVVKAPESSDLSRQQKTPLLVFSLGV